MSTMFRLPGLFLAWGIGNGDWTPESLVKMAATAGFKWIAQQFDSPDGRADPDADLVQRLRLACRSIGMHYGVWQVAPRSLDVLLATRPNFWILNVETDYFDYSALLAEFRATHKKLPAAVVTDCGLRSAPFIRYEVKAMPECYQQAPNGADLTPANMVARCKEEGWRLVFPCLGAYDGYPLSDYHRAGDGYSVYLAEGMQPADWKTAASWNGKT